MGLSHDSGDCSERICPYELAWVDTPDKNGRRHKYAECSGQGICNRESGQCECFTGFEGKACARSVCPNSCSGHGRCTNIEDLSYGASPFDYAQGSFLEELATFDYYQWDSSKTRGCVCDPGYGDVDCSKRMCSYGNDVMDSRLNMNVDRLYQTQKITITAESADATTEFNHKTFALTFKSKLNETYTTQPIKVQTSNFATFLSDVQSSLMSLPNGVIDAVQVHGSNSGNEIYLNITFTGEYVQGPQYLLTVNSKLCGDGCTPKLSGLDSYPGGNQNVSEVQLADYNSYECGRRGKCDYTTGICECFEGYTGASCGSVTALI